MQKYKTLLFDVDNTLLDFNAAEETALKLLFSERGIALTLEMKERYKVINRRLWKCFENGKLDREEVLNTRFQLLFDEYGLEENGVLLEKQYRLFLEQGHQLIDGAEDLIKSLHSEYDLYIVTNGVSRTQYRRLTDAGLYPFFKDIFVSEDIGYQKPMKQYFDYVFGKIQGFSHETTLIIGDSLSADMKGGVDAGIDSCWFTRIIKPNNSTIQPTYRIQKLEELYAILR